MQVDPEIFVMTLEEIGTALGISRELARRDFENGMRKLRAAFRVPEPVKTEEDQQREARERQNDYFRKWKRKNPKKWRAYKQRYNAKRRKKSQNIA